MHMGRSIMMGETVDLAKFHLDAENALKDKAKERDSKKERVRENGIKNQQLRDGIQGYQKRIEDLLHQLELI